MKCQDDSFERCILTFGYGNRSNHLDFTNYLHAFNVVCVVDVRLTSRAWSRKWYGEEIEKICLQNNVSYISMKSLGNTSGTRKWIPSNFEEAQEDLQKLSMLVTKGNFLLLCAELDSSACHRTDVALELGTLMQIPVKHLR
ncbi:DUF488 family protein [Candidatus Cyanaurora vandensis]